MTFQILIVDDEQPITELLSRHLTMQGYEVTTSNDPLEALDMVTQRHFHIVLSDIDMPGMSGIDLLKAIKRHNGIIHVIMITGHVLLSHVLDCMRRGADTCVFKPFDDLGVITRAVESACRDIEHWHGILKELQSTSTDMPETSACDAA